MSIESQHLVIGKNPYTEEMAIGLDPENFGTDALECFVWSLMNRQKTQVIAFGRGNRSITFFRQDWFETTKGLPTKKERENRVMTAVIAIKSADRVIATGIPPNA